MQKKSKDHETTEAIEESDSYKIIRNANNGFIQNILLLNATWFIKLYPEHEIHLIARNTILRNIMCHKPFE